MLLLILQNDSLSSWELQHKVKIRDFFSGTNFYIYRESSIIPFNLEKSVTFKGRTIWKPTE